MEKHLKIDPVDLSELEQVKGGGVIDIKGCLIANGKCKEGGCGIANGKCPGTGDPDPGDGGDNGGGNGGDNGDGGDLTINPNPSKPIVP